MAKITTTGCKKRQMARWKAWPEQLFDRFFVCSHGWGSRFALIMFENEDRVWRLRGNLRFGDTLLPWPAIDLYSNTSVTLSRRS